MHLSDNLLSIPQIILNACNNNNNNQFNGQDKLSVLVLVQ